METKRIVMTSTFFPPFHLGGDATHVRMLRDELARRGHEVHVLHSLDAYMLKRGGELPSAAPDALVRGVRGPFGKWSAVGTYVAGRNRRAERELSSMVSEVRPDWLHHHNVSLLGAGLLRDWGVPSVYTAHDYWLACPRSDLMYRGRETCAMRRCAFCSIATGRPPQLWRAWREGPMLRPLRTVIAPSRFMSDQLAKFLGLEPVVLPNFAPAPPTAARPSGGRTHFSFVGVLERSKGLDLVLQAFRAKDAKAELHVMGKGSMEGEVREAERETGGRISYKGFISGEPLWTEVSGSIALLAPSAGNENSPLACIEALSMGVPLIVSAKGGLPELVKDPECGIVMGLDAASIGEAVRRLAEDGETARRLSENAFIRYERHHTPQLYLNSYISLCERVIG